ncbi:MAG: class I tRNA ligase family protein [Dehalococcoidales bacterium]
MNEPNSTASGDFIRDIVRQDIAKNKNGGRVQDYYDNVRPTFPKRAIITAGMPYGNKELHLGHIGGVFIHADTYARFLRDRIGKDNVIFVSGTDCYGSPILEYYRQQINQGLFKGTIEEFVQFNHERQKEVLKSYDISLNLFGASSLGRTAEIHRQESIDFITKLYENGHLVKLTTSQFYDAELGVFLNGRQVVGQCPIAGCSSEWGCADECSLGHQYMPVDLINPRSTLTGKKPEMRDVTNWYFKLDKFHALLKLWVEDLEKDPASRRFVTKSIREFLEPPVVYVKREQFSLLSMIKEKLPEYSLTDEDNKPSITLTFKSVEEREKACLVLAENNIRYRTGKTLVPFRLTGNIEWGVPAPALEGLDDLTVWVWPESLWAPISFTMAYLESQNKGMETWKDWWCSKAAQVYQFIGEDNIYFYGPAEMAMFMGSQGKNPSFDVPEGELQIPKLVCNSHVLFLNKKASSSGEIKPPMARELLDYYTFEQLRAHFLSLGLAMKSVSFQPKLGQRSHPLQRPHLRPAHPRLHPPRRKRRGLLPALGRIGRRLAAPNPHRTVLPRDHGHLPMAAQAGGRERTEDLRVRRIRRRAVQEVGVRGQTARPTGALLPHRHRGHAAVATGAQRPAPTAARTDRESRATTGSPASRATNAAPRLRDVGGHPAPSGLLLHFRPRQPLANHPHGL